MFEMNSVVTGKKCKSFVFHMVLEFNSDDKVIA
jgi:hypothetical protein